MVVSSRGSGSFLDRSSRRCSAAVGPPSKQRQRGRGPRLALSAVLRLRHLRTDGRRTLDREPRAPLALPTSERARALIAWLALHPGSHPRSAWSRRSCGRTSRPRARGPTCAPRCGRSARRGASADAPLAATRTTRRRWPTTSGSTPGRRAVAGRGFAELLPGLDDEWVRGARAERTTAGRRALAGARGARRGRRRPRRGACAGRAASCALRPLDEAAHRALVERLLPGRRAGGGRAWRPGSSPSGCARRSACGPRRRPGPCTPACGGAGQRAAPGRVFGRAQRARPADRAAGGGGRRARPGRGAHGEAGIGKTTLLAELARRATAAGGHAAVDGRHRRRRARPRSPRGSTWPGRWPRGVRQAAGHGHLAGRAQPALARTSAPGSATPSSRRPRPPRSWSGCGSSRRVLRLVEWSCAERPTLLALDDAHRADRASLRLTAYVGRRLATPARAARAGPARGRAATRAGRAAGRPGRARRAGQHARRAADQRRRGRRAGPFAARARRRRRREGRGRRRGQPAARRGDHPRPGRRQRRSARPTCAPPSAATLSRLPEPTRGRRRARSRRPGGRCGPSELRRSRRRRRGGDIEAGSEGLLVRREGRLGFRHELLRDAVYAGLPDAGGPARPAGRRHRPGRARRAGPPPGRGGTGARVGGRSWPRRPPRRGRSARSTRRPSCSSAAVAADPDDGALWLELEEVYAWAAPAATTWRRPGPRRCCGCPPPTCRRPGAAAAASSAPSPAIPRSRCAPTARPSCWRRPTPIPRVRADALIGLAWGDAVAGTGTRGRAPARRRPPRLVDLGPQAAGRRDGDPDAGPDPTGPLRRGGRPGRRRRATRPCASGGVPDRAYGVLVNAACALVCIGEDEARAGAGRPGAGATTAVTGLALKTLAARAQVLARLGRHEEAGA